LKDPWGLIRRHASLLSPNGIMLICVPNIEHWSFADRLLRGTWDYEPSGLLDATHLRWFSLESMRRGLVGTGLSLCDVHPRVFDAERARQFASALAPGLSALGIDSEAYARRAAPLQYIWRVRRQPQQRLLLAGNMLAPVGGVSHVRVLQPLQAMGTDPQVSVQVTDRIEVGKPADATPRIFILHRPSLSGEQGRQTLRTLMDAGYLVVTEFDDHPDFFQSMQDPDQLSFRGVHAVQTSTPALAEVLRRHNPEIAVFPNAIASLPEVRNFTEGQPLTCFFGALNREQDWRELMPAINAVSTAAAGRPTRTMKSIVGYLGWYVPSMSALMIVPFRYVSGIGSVHAKQAQGVFARRSSAVTIAPRDPHAGSEAARRSIRLNARFLHDARPLQRLVTEEAAEGLRRHVRRLGA